MQRPLPGDLTIFARVITRVPTHRRRALARLLIAEANEALAYRAKSGRSHPRFGDGSLSSRLFREDLPPPTWADDPDFLVALRIVAEEVLKHTAS